MQLDAAIESGGCNLSMGQRHLLSIARMLLSRPRLLLLDEPTAHLDPETAEAVLHTVWRVLPNTSMIHVSHDLITVIRYDKVLVVDAGMIAEEGAPNVLLEDKAGLFSSMVHAAGPDVATGLKRAANGSNRACGDQQSKCIVTSRCTGNRASNSWQC